MVCFVLFCFVVDHLEIHCWEKGYRCVCGCGEGKTRIAIRWPLHSGDDNGLG